MEHSDRELVCASCSQAFLFTGGEQAYYAQNGLQEPRRCKPCRAQRKVTGGDAAPTRRGGGGGGGGSSNGNGGARTGGPRAPRGGNQGFRMASPEDPNGYRAPGFHSQQPRAEFNANPAAANHDDVDDESEGQAAMLGPARLGMEGNVDRFGLRTTTAQPLTSAAPARRPGPARAPRPNGGGQFGAVPRRTDRSGTDPNGYRSPAFAGSEPAPPRAAPATTTGPSRRERRPQRMRHEAVCADCGVQALVPFQPGPDRPAYCKTCYQVRKANGTAPTPGANAQLGSDSVPSPAPEAEPAVATGAGN